MVSIPINIVNLICEFAAGDDKNWYPFFNPKTEILSWKVNRFSKKWNKNAEIILHKNLYIVEGRVSITSYRNWVISYPNMEFNYKAIILKESGFIKMFLEFGENNETNFHSMLYLIDKNDYSFKITNRIEYVYIDKTIYAEIDNVIYEKTTNDLFLEFAMF
jgi:hypothetical protein